MTVKVLGWLGVVKLWYFSMEFPNYLRFYSLYSSYSNYLYLFTFFIFDIISYNYYYIIYYLIKIKFVEGPYLAGTA